MLLIAMLMLLRLMLWLLRLNAMQTVYLFRNRTKVFGIISICFFFCFVEFQVDECDHDSSVVYIDTVYVIDDDESESEQKMHVGKIETAVGHDNGQVKEEHRDNEEHKVAIGCKNEELNEEKPNAERVEKCVAFDGEKMHKPLFC